MVDPYENKNLTENRRGNQEWTIQTLEKFSTRRK